MFHKQNRLKIIAKLRRTIRPFKTYTSKEYLQVFKNSFIAVEAKIIRVTFVRSHVVVKPIIRV